MTKTNQTLAQISTKIKALEKNDIKSAIEKGRLLKAAEEKCEYGEFMKWLKSEFGWSHETSRRLRSVYELSQNPQIVDFHRLNISISALYLVAELIVDNDDNEEELAKGMAVIEAARQRRVSYKEARKIIDEIEEQQKPKPKPEPEPEPEPEPDDDTADDESEPEPEPEPDDDADNGNDTAGDEPDDENEDADVPNEREIAGVFEMLDATLWGQPKNFDWQKVIEIVSAEKIHLIISGLTTILDQHKASQPPEPTKRTKLKQKEKESVH